jgi:hypothetical protein
MVHKNNMKVTFEVYTNFDMSVDEATEEFLKAEVALNSSSKLRWHLQEIVLENIKSFTEDVIHNK